MVVSKTLGRSETGVPPAAGTYDLTHASILLFLCAMAPNHIPFVPHIVGIR